MRTFNIKKIIASVFAIIMALVSVQIPAINKTADMTAEAASTDYPIQLMNLSLYDNSKNLTASAAADKSSCGFAAPGGTRNEQWRIDYCGSDANGAYYKIVNQLSGRLLTPVNYSVSAGNEVVVYGNENDKSQYWYISEVQKDDRGNGLYYKIVNYSNKDLALTSGANTTLSAYSGANNQKWLLNCAGLQGFAGYCKDDNTGKVKAGDIGGLLGETVEVSNFADLKKYATADKPYTIIVNNNISVSELNLNGERYMCTAGRIYVHNNKTIIGSYSKHTLFNVQFCTSTNSGVGDNIIIKNFDMQHDAESNNNDSIVCYFGSGENIWVDHVTFTGHNGYGYAPKTGKVDEDKFLACCYDADYCTVSDCSFGGHKYGLILGYPADSASLKSKYGGYPRMSLMGNKFYDTNTRGPGLMRWGYYHSMNNYVNKFSMAYTVISDSNIYAENCVYENGGNVICDWDKMDLAGHYSESGSSFSGCSRTKQGGDSNSTALACSWRPSANYTYKSLSAADAKTYTSNYSGCQSDKNKVNYIAFSTAGVQSAGYMSGVEDGWGPTAPEIIPHNACFMIKNLNSGLFLEVKDGKAENGANIQQWGADPASPGAWNTWRFVPSGEEGYYYIQSMLGNKNLVIDVTGAKSDNGTNIELYSYNGKNNQKFRLMKNSDGSYKIAPKSSEDKYVEVAGAETSSGANVALWENTNHDCQKWTLTEVGFDGETMDTAVSYMFKNVNSGLYMEAAGNNDADGTNIQQWEANGNGDNNSGKWNSWHLIHATGDLYFIASNMDGERYISVNGENAELMTYDKTVNTQMMRFVKNPDGTYLILTRAGYDKSTSRYTKGLEIEYASKDKGGNVRQWELNGNACQNWEAETVKAEEKPEIFDLNGDGEMNAADVVLLQRFLVKKESFTDEQFGIADINKDGKVNVFDLVCLKRIIVQR